MKSLVIYDSQHGNTEDIARAIARGLGEQSQAVRASQADPDLINNCELLVLGSPTHGGRPTPSLQTFLKNVPASSMKEKCLAVFDTRFYKPWVKIFGFAANRLSKSFKKKGYRLIADPEPFYVIDTEGPLQEGELERAEEWGKSLAKHS